MNNNNQNDNPMQVDAGKLLDEYKKQVADLEFNNKVQQVQLQNYQQLVAKLNDQLTSLQKTANNTTEDTPKDVTPEEDSQDNQD